MESSIRRAFSRFTCERDADVAFFLKAHAIQNEGTGASRTFLALSSEALGAAANVDDTVESAN